MGEKTNLLYQKIDYRLFGGFYYFYILMIKIKCSPTEDSEIIFMTDIILKSTWVNKILGLVWTSFIVCHVALVSDQFQPFREKT